MIAVKKRRYVVDEQGKRVAVMVDLPTYEKFIDAVEELEDIRAYDESKNKVSWEVKEGQAITLQEYLRKRKKKSR